MASVSDSSRHSYKQKVMLSFQFFLKKYFFIFLRVWVVDIALRISNKYTLKNPQYIIRTCIRSWNKSEGKNDNKRPFIPGNSVVNVA